MKITAILSVIVSISSLLFYFPAQAVDVQLHETPAQVYFSPQDACTVAIVKEIDKAKSGILLQAYSFTSEEISSALVFAHKRGVHVEVILDKSNLTAKSSAGDVTLQAGIPTHIDAKHAIANSKIMIIDGVTVITGSFNFTRAAAEKNAENLLIIRNRELAGLYTGNWKKHREHTERYLRK